MGQREYAAVARSLTGYRPLGNSPGRTTEAAPFALISPKAIACSTAHSRGPRLCGIWAGIFTATEAAAVAALWALLIGLVWYRNLSLSGQRAFHYVRARP